MKWPWNRQPRQSAQRRAYAKTDVPPVYVCPGCKTRFRCRNCWQMCAASHREVHHRDGDPRNNDLDNLELR
jgi:hypothetical protein